MGEPIGKQVINLIFLVLKIALAVIVIRTLLMFLGFSQNVPFVDPVIYKIRDLLLNFSRLFFGNIGT